MVPRELVEDQEGRELRKLVERRPERVDVVQNPSCDDGVERARIVELLERDAPVERTWGRLGIDGENVVARLGKRRRDAALAAAADLEDALGRRW